MLFLIKQSELREKKNKKYISHAMEMSVTRKYKCGFMARKSFHK